MAYEIKLYDESKVSNQVKRLAACFNMAVDAKHRENAEYALKDGHDLYKETTGEQGKITALNEDERAYLRLTFMKMTAKTEKAFGWTTVSEVVLKGAESLEKKALKLILPA